MPCRRQFRVYILDIKLIMDLVTYAVNAFFTHDLSDILRCVVFTCHSSCIVQRRSGKMIVVDMCDQHRVRTHDFLRSERRFICQRHIKSFQHRVDHDHRAACIDHSASAGKPADFSTFDLTERFRSDVFNSCRDRLPFAVGNYIHSVSPQIELFI